jgi:hypothetical protein
MDVFACKCLTRTDSKYGVLSEYLLNLQSLQCIINEIAYVMSDITHWPLDNNKADPYNY